MKNKQRKEIKIAQETFWTFLYANLIFLAVIFGIYLVVYYGIFPFLIGTEPIIPDFLGFSYDSAKWYMIIYGGIGAYYYLPQYVQLGMTRKKSFIGIALGVIGGAVTLVLLTLVISEVYQLLSGWLGLGVEGEPTLFNNYIGVSDGSFEVDTGFLSNNTFLASASRLGITVLSYIVSATLHYMLGWMVGTAFYRSDFLEGVGSVVLALLFAVMADLLWGDGVLGIFPRITFSTNIITQWFVAILGTIALIGLSLWIIRALTKKMTIKLN